MHQIALLRSENQTLREENALLSQCRRAKKRHLREGGSLTVREGQNIQRQSEVDMQIQEEMPQKSGRKGRTETKARRCGVCGKTGHNSRTCQINVEMS